MGRGEEGEEEGGGVQGNWREGEKRRSRDGEWRDRGRRGKRSGKRELEGGVAGGTRRAREMSRPLALWPSGPLAPWHSDRPRTGT